MIGNLSTAHQWLEDFTGTWDAAELKNFFLAAITTAGKKNIELLWPLRVTLSLRPASPDVFDLLDVLGRDESLRRLEFITRA